ncbi:MAG: PTS sugar transporter subunit IIB [Armatimonadota bacterium]|nr:PTS sugar transporter subunit IIB [Armatimonadota bacterium]
MTAKKRILIVCGTAIATSTHVAARVREVCQAQGIDVEITQARVQEVPAYAHSVDLVVATTQVAYPLNVPVVSGIPFLTGIGEDKTAEQIVQYLTKGG